MARQQSFGYNKSITPARKLTTRLLRIAKRFEKKKDDLKIAQQQADLRRFRYVEIRNEDYCHTETISGIGDYSSGLQIKEAEREVQRIVERLRNDKDCDIYVHCGNSTVKMHSHLVFPQCGALAGNYNAQKRAAAIRGEDLQLPVLFELEISTRDFFVVIAFLYGHIQLTRRLVLGMVTKRDCQVEEPSNTAEVSIRVALPYKRSNRFERAMRFYALAGRMGIPGLQSLTLDLVALMSFRGSSMVVSLLNALRDCVPDPDLDLRDSRKALAAFNAARSNWADITRLARYEVSDTFDSVAHL
ncbi:hypothetical protein BJ508DRAFT_333362 [Ascobolus immersus RN42]|uniref:BTB domain-containing protein n=1 Tax=Ascobolus immersus RN42 TaxID=1160509 RepID=A0A3N4HJP1_ASCIM|nr:hypothetical protein BJ508DRAFT_333362 [Ascobolus immersus RN42]